MEIKIDSKDFEISVILTLFNSKNYFKKAIDSLLNQTFKDFEVIIVDDGSTDDSESDIFPILKANLNFKYVRHSNRNHPLSLNTGIKCSSGKFITFLDSDDEYLPEHLDLRINFFSENPEIDFTHSPALIIGNEDDFWVPDANDNSKLIHLNNCIIGGTLFGKRKVFEELGGFKNIYSHDFDFYNRVLENGKFKISKFESFTYKYYRNNPESVINKLKKIYGE